MRFLVVLCLISFSTLAEAQHCAADSDCPQTATCIGESCTPTSVVAAPGFFESLTLSLGLGTGVEVFPVSSQKVPGSTRGQFSSLAGIRFSIGTRLPNRFRLLAVIEAGYVSAGYLPGRAADGVMEGAGLELALDYFKRVKPFIRVMYEAVVVPIRTSSEGTLANNAAFVSLGARVSVFELHLSVGRDFAGGISAGLGDRKSVV